jgi:hypothetical protein
MSYLTNREFYTEVSKGNIAGHSVVHKFGQNNSVGATFVPVTRSGVYHTLQPASATTLRVKSGNVNDTAAGSGAQEVTVQGLDETGALVTEALATAGTSASATTTATFIRQPRAWVSKSGTYATSSAGSHAGDIVIENGAGGTDWCLIESSDFPRGQSEIGVYTIPVGYTGYLVGAFGFVESTKITDLLFFKREGITKASAPYDAMRIVFEERSEGGQFSIDIKAPIKLGTACDCGFMAKVDTGTAQVEVDFELLLVDNNYL